MDTLGALERSLRDVPYEIIVVDNGSDDDTAARLQRERPGVRVIETGTNAGVDGFNTGANAATAPFLLVLDDDAFPDKNAVRRALDELRADDTLGAVALHPRHPDTGASEWAFADPALRDERWPMFIAGFVIRRECWDEAGGFDPEYFLYANDTDLALKLLATGRGVLFRPDLIVWHDSDTALRRPDRWFRLATRNRVWTAKRHARPLLVLPAIVLGTLESHARAGLRPRAHALTLRGLLEGVCTPPSAWTPPGASRRVFARLIGARLGRNAGTRSARLRFAELPERPRVTAVIPAFGRQSDLDAILADLDASERAGCEVDVIVVDNASDPPLAIQESASLRVSLLCLEENLGGSGGFNAGMRRALRANAEPSDLVWLLDSDVRVGPRVLEQLVESLRSDPDRAATGPALRDPQTGVEYERAGVVDRRIGHYGPFQEGPAGEDEPSEPDYIASCCALVRREAIERTGLMPDLFLNGDDVTWFIRMQRATGASVGTARGCVANHPNWSRFPTPSRYYAARNAFVPIDELALPPRVRLARSLLEVAHALNLLMLGSRAGAGCVLGGLRGAVRREQGRAPSLESWRFEPEPVARFDAVVAGLAPPERVRIHPALVSHGVLRSLYLGARAQDTNAPSTNTDRRLAMLLADLRTLLARAFGGPAPDVVVAPAHWPTAWMCARTVVAVSTDGFVVRRTDPLRMSVPALLLLVRGVTVSARLALRRRQRSPFPPITDPDDLRAGDHAAHADPRREGVA